MRGGFGRGGGDRGNAGYNRNDRNNDRGNRFDQNRPITQEKTQERAEIKPNSAAAAALAIAGMSNKANEPATETSQLPVVDTAVPPPSGGPKPSVFSAFVQGNTA